MATIVEAQTRPEIRVEDVEYQRQGGKALLARVYRPAGTGPFPAVVQVHGGAWTSKDRTDNDFISRAFAESGILVASLDFRMPPEAPYPASLADINLGIRWLKARARTYGSRPDWVVDPLLRYHLAKKAGNAELVENHHAFWRDEATMSEGSPPAILDRGDKVHLPPALVFGGDSDEWVPVETMQRLVAGWKKAGGDIELQFYKGANHGFMTGKPDAPYARPAIERMKAFIRAHTG